MPTRQQEFVLHHRVGCSLSGWSKKQGVYLADDPAAGGAYGQNPELPIARDADKALPAIDVLQSCPVDLLTGGEEGVVQLVGVGLLQVVDCLLAKDQGVWHWR